MKAKEYNGHINTWRKLPKTYQGDSKLYMSFNKSSDEVLKSEGFYDVVTPSYDSISQRLGAIEFDEDNDVFTYPVTNIDFDATYEEIGDDLEPTGETLPVYDIDALKATKKEDVNAQAGNYLKPTDWYVIRKSERDVSIPSAIATERADVITKADGFVTAIEALTTVESVLRYTFNFYPVEL
tara:strand:+ start:1502 stop:2047 length:546 start_codon:yes stop_codon:yes gene_type:complete